MSTVADESRATPRFVIRRGGAGLTKNRGSKPTPAQCCLVRAATGPVNEIEEALREWRSLVDLSGPIDGGSFRLIPLVYHRLNSAGIDDPHLGMFKGIYRRSMVENSLTLDAATPALQALADAGITPWLHKGAALVQAGYYPTVASRPMADVDIVVHSSQRQKAISTLIDLGYRPMIPERRMLQLHASMFVNLHGHELDLHWHHLNHARSVEVDSLLTRATHETTLNGIPVNVPGPTGLLIVSALHGSLPNREPTVRWLVDAALILGRHPNEIVWDDVVEFATRFRLARRLERAFTILAETTDCAVPDSTMAALAAVPTYLVERLERRISTAPWNSLRWRGLRLLTGYAGGDRELKHLATGLPRYLAVEWNVDAPQRLPAVAARKFLNMFNTERS